MTDLNSNLLYLGRQPILNEKMALFGYELLFRPGNVKAVTVQDDTYATSKVMVNLLNTLGPTRILGKKKGFINFHEKMILDEAYELLDPNRFVLEILERVEPTEELVSALRIAVRKGYEIALDDFDFSDAFIQKFQGLFPLLSYVKVDVLKASTEDLKKKLSLFKDYPIKIIAEKVETEEKFKELKALGFKYFQGFFFAKAEVVEEKGVDPHLRSIMNLLSLVQQEPDMDVLEDEFKRSPEITINLFRFLNSAAVGIRAELGSVSQAVALLGLKKLKQWLMMMMYAKDGDGGSPSTLLVSAAHRARTMELILDKLGSSEHEKGFLTGILSQLNVVYKTPMKYLLKELHVDDEIQKAILEHEGILGKLLDLTIALEELNDDIVEEILENLKIKKSEFRELVLESYQWVERMDQ